MSRKSMTCAVLQLPLGSAVENGACLPGCARRRAASPARSPWQMVFEQSRDGLVVLDADGLVLAVNPAAATHLACCARSLVGRDYRDLCWNLRLPDDEAGRVADAIARALWGEAVSDREIQIPLSGGARRFGLEVRPLAPGAGRRNLAVLRLSPPWTGSGLEALQRHLIDSMAHELRTAIHGFLDLLEQAGEGMDAAMRRDCLRLMRESVDDLRALAENALQEAAVAAGSGRRERVNLASVVEEVVEGLRPGIGERRLSLTVELPAVLGPVWGDPDLLGEMIRQIARNGVQYSEAGGALHIRGYHQAGCAVVEIRDEGRGIPAADQPLIFEPLFRSKSVVKDGIPGGGFGLSVAKKIAVRHRGAISAWSREGAGTVFIIRLPLGGSPDAGGEESPCH